MLRIRVDAMATFAHVVQQVHSKLLLGLAHPYAPVEGLVRDVGLRRCRTTFPVVLIHHGRKEKPEPYFTRYEPPVNSSRFDLSVQTIISEDDVLDITVFYAAELFDGCVVRAFASKFVRALEASAAHRVYSLAVIGVKSRRYPLGVERRSSASLGTQLLSVSATAPLFAAAAVAFAAALSALSLERQLPPEIRLTPHPGDGRDLAQLTPAVDVSA